MDVKDMSPHDETGITKENCSGTQYLIRRRLVFARRSPTITLHVVTGPLATEKRVDLKFFWGLGQKKFCRNWTAHMEQKESKLGHDSIPVFCRIAHSHPFKVKIEPRPQLLISKKLRRSLA